MERFRLLEIFQVQVLLHDPIRAITPGQSVVFFQGEEALAVARLKKYKAGSLAQKVVKDDFIESDFLSF